MNRVNVDLGNRSYAILIGENLDQSIEQFFNGSRFSKKALVIVDSNTRQFYTRAIESNLDWKARGI